MEWISVEEALPKNNEQVLTLNEGYFPLPNDVLFQRQSFKIFQGSFHRSTGWNIPYCPGICAVKYWMSLPEAPEEK